jgi:Lar family restriction alleviation protein
MRKKELKPCIFCGSDEVDIGNLQPWGDNAVFCNKCGAQGPSFDHDEKKSKKKAVKAWNKRAGEQDD